MVSEETLLYRNGFIVSGVDKEPAAGTQEWSCAEIHGWQVASHPDTRVVRIDHDSCPAIAFGDAFLPERGIFDSEAAFQRMAADMAEGLECFHQGLDEVCGRFALLIRSPEGWRLYHDALGSRSIFYSLTRPIFASHVELLADTLALRPGDHFIPYIISKNYLARDVKYLPGVATPYDDLRQLTPNTALDLAQIRPVRYWPRTEMVPHDDEEQASAALIAHLKALARFVSASELQSFLGLTGGSDSRGLLAGLADLAPQTFTWVRSPTGTQATNKESHVAAELAEMASVAHQSFAIKAPPRLNDASDAVARAYRRNTGYFRGIDGGWQRQFLDADYGHSLFVRGFGGEVLRGFYQKDRNALRRVNARQLANTYDVNAGSQVTRNFFEEFIDLTGLTDESCLGYDPNDLFYWEHRMGTWGSIALTESDIALRGLSGYNSRSLYRLYMSLNWEARTERRPIHEAISRLSPSLGAIPYI